jgi:hypothetical protein
MWINTFIRCGREGIKPALKTTSPWLGTDVEKSEFIRMYRECINLTGPSTHVIVPLFRVLQFQRILEISEPHHRLIFFSCAAPSPVFLLLPHCHGHSPNFPLFARSRPSEVSTLCRFLVFVLRCHLQLLYEECLDRWEKKKKELFPGDPTLASH